VRWMGARVFRGVACWVFHNSSVQVERHGVQTQLDRACVRSKSSTAVAQD
jgi:hypothetical protein